MSNRIYCCVTCENFHDEDRRNCEKCRTMELFIRALWRRIEPYKNKFGKDLPEILPDEFSSAAFVATHFYEEKIKHQKERIQQLSAAYIEQKEENAELRGDLYREIGSTSS